MDWEFTSKKEKGKPLKSLSKYLMVLARKMAVYTSGVNSVIQYQHKGKI